MLKFNLKHEKSQETWHIIQQIMREAESYMNTNCWIISMEKKWKHHVSSTYCSGSWLLVAFCSCSSSLQFTVYMSTDHYHVGNTMTVAKVLTCVLRHAQIHPKIVEPENEILLSILHTKVIPNCDFRRCSIFPNNCAPNKESETWRRYDMPAMYKNRMRTPSLQCVILSETNTA
jgi:hypothetical protein